ncbi:hypothetical protein HK104_008372 [Borealophlyctis nickersoniae]|nr:hypothetical protein HK104_008372 [Borealophlyctis nickersoniae]
MTTPHQPEPSNTNPPRQLPNLNTPRQPRRASYLADRRPKLLFAEDYLPNYTPVAPVYDLLPPLYYKCVNDWFCWYIKIYTPPSKIKRFRKVYHPLDIEAHVVSTDGRNFVHLRVAGHASFTVELPDYLNLTPGFGFL